MKTIRLFQRRAAVVLAVSVLSGMASAQQQPITGQMMASPATAATPALATPPAPSPGEAPPAATPSPAMAQPAFMSDYYPTQTGDTTRHLLQMQARGDHAAPARPMLGVEASIAWRRYLKSFEHPIPEFYETAVGKSTGNGR